MSEEEKMTINQRRKHLCAVKETKQSTEKVSIETNGSNVVEYSSKARSE